MSATGSPCSRVRSAPLPTVALAPLLPAPRPRVRSQRHQRFSQLCRGRPLRWVAMRRRPVSSKRGITIPEPRANGTGEHQHGLDTWADEDRRGRPPPGRRGSGHLCLGPDQVLRRQEGEDGRAGQCLIPPPTQASGRSHIEVGAVVLCASRGTRSLVAVSSRHRPDTAIGHRAGRVSWLLAEDSSRGCAGSGSRGRIAGVCRRRCV
jgi:hypothetical protein